MVNREGSSLSWTVYIQSTRAALLGLAGRLNHCCLDKSERVDARCGAWMFSLREGADAGEFRVFPWGFCGRGSGRYPAAGCEKYAQVALDYSGPMAETGICLGKRLASVAGVSNSGIIRSSLSLMYLKIPRAVRGALIFYSFLLDTPLRPSLSREQLCP